MVSFPVKREDTLTHIDTNFIEIVRMAAEDNFGKEFLPYPRVENQAPVFICT